MTSSVVKNLGTVPACVLPTPELNFVRPEISSKNSAAVRTCVCCPSQEDKKPRWRKRGDDLPALREADSCPCACGVAVKVQVAKTGNAPTPETGFSSTGDLVLQIPKKPSYSRVIAMWYSQARRDSKKRASSDSSSELLSRQVPIRVAWSLSPQLRGRGGAESCRKRPSGPRTISGLLAVSGRPMLELMGMPAPWRFWTMSVMSLILMHNMLAPRS